MNVQSIIQQLTLHQKAALLSGKTTWETFDFTSEGVPSIFLSDGPTGLRKQEGAGDHLGLNQSVLATCFPTAATLANSWDTELCEAVGAAIGREAAAQDVHVLLGPGLNIKRNPLCGRNFEYYSEDPYLSGKLAAGFIRGVQSEGVAACPKHFAVNSQELRRMSSDSVVDERTLREIYTTGFEIAVKEAQPLTIMSSYNKVNGVYANESAHLLSKLLRDEWGYQGIVVSDWGGDNDRVSAVKNGSHLAMPSMGLVGQREIVEAVQRGELDEAVLDQRVSELLAVISTLHEEEKNKQFDSQQHHALAKKAAQESIVLLKNEQHILPLAASTRVAVIGDFAQEPRYQGAGSSLVNPTQVDTFLEAIEKAELEVVGFSKGYHRDGSSDEILIDEAVSLAKQSSVVLVYVGLDEMSESEGLDRSHLSIPKNQLALLERLSQEHDAVVALVAAGSVIDFSWEKNVQGILHGYLKGQAGETALVDALVGTVNPSGKLAETYPMQLSEVPSSREFPATGEHALYREGLYVGYRYFDKVEVPVQYPFGYGLSYTTFEYEEVKVTEQGVQVTLKNTGSVYGEEIIQLYVGLPNSKVYRAVKELKGFIKVGLNPGEVKMVTIPFDDKTFRFYDVTCQQWSVEQGEYVISVGAHSQDIRLTATMKVDGVTFSEKQQAQLQSYWSGQVMSVSDEEFEQVLNRPLPQPTIMQKGQLVLNSPLSDMQYAKSSLARLMFKLLRHQLQKAEQKGKPDLNMLFLYNMPFRALAKMTNGAIDLAMVQGILTMVNGRGFKGMSQIFGAWRQKRNYERKVSL